MRRKTTYFYAIRASIFAKSAAIREALEDGAEMQGHYVEGDKVLTKIYANATGFKLAYAIQGVEVRAHVAYCWTFPKFGGRRLWFECPSCRRRVGVLYMAGSVACRECLRLVYPCQYADRISRGTSLMHRWRQRLKGGWGRPRYMHQTTYERLREKVAERENKALQRFISNATYQRLMRKYGK